MEASASDLHNLSILMGLLSLVSLIVFFVMSANVAKIKKSIDNYLEKAFIYHKMGDTESAIKFYKMAYYQLKFRGELSDDLSQKIKANLEILNCKDILE